VSPASWELLSAQPLRAAYTDCGQCSSVKINKHSVLTQFIIYLILTKRRSDRSTLEPANAAAIYRCATAIYWRAGAIYRSAAAAQVQQLGETRSGLTGAIGSARSCRAWTHPWRQHRRRRLARIRPSRARARTRLLTGQSCQVRTWPKYCPSEPGLGATGIRLTADIRADFGPVRRRAELPWASPPPTNGAEVFTWPDGGKTSFSERYGRRLHERLLRP
jgi:hypothetical protein